MLDKLFKLKENNTSVRTEVFAGLTTFMAMAYILAVNPDILKSAGMNPDAVLLATAPASFIGCTLFNAIPADLKKGVSAGIGSFIAFID